MEITKEPRSAVNGVGSGKNRFRLTSVLLWGFIAVTWFNGCHGNEQPALQTLVFRELPSNSDPYPPHHLILRTNFEGSVEFIEAKDFLIEVNVTAPNVDELSKVHYDYTEMFGSIVLQLYEAQPTPQPFILSQVPINYILMALGGAVCLAFITSLIYVCWWNIARRPGVEEDVARNKALSPDSSQAPLLDGRPNPEMQAADAANRARKRRKKPNHQLGPGEEYMSSEDDMADGTRLPPSGSPRKHYSVPHRGPAAKDTDLYATVKKDPGYAGTTISSEGMTTESTPLGSQVDVHPTKPVVSYIKIHGGPDDTVDGTATKQRLSQSQYVPLGKDATLDSQATLKVRRGDSYDDTMPDVIKSRTLPRGGTAPRGVDSGRYVSLKAPTTEPKESDYSTVNKQLTGAQIAHMISSDRIKGSPKFSHNTDRAPSTFTAGHRDRDDRLELDSVGSSRSGESTSGARTISSPFSHGTDSDSAKSSASSSLFRGRGEPVAGGDGKFVLQQPPPGRSASYGHAASTATDHSSDSGHGGSNPRLVDEAYGTMSANNNSNTLRSSSTASTGSGSSGSVVTVVAADGENTLGRRKYGPPRGGTNGGGGGMGRSPHKYLHASIICSLCLISIATGVYSQLVTKTTANIRVYVPPGFLKYHPQVFFREGLKVTVTTQYTIQSLDVERFEVPDAQILERAIDRCRKNCGHGCDPNTGACLCRVGYKLQGAERCEDVDECSEDADICSTRANCENIPGSYRCKCRNGFYGDNNVCYSCHEPCRNGTYEVIACDNQHPKMCKECSQSCQEGYYISAQCTPTSDVFCKRCQDKCAYKQYEYSPCYGKQDRDCKAIDNLPPPVMSKNLIFEDLRRVKRVLTPNMHQRPDNRPMTDSRKMQRESDFSVNVRLTETNLAPLYRPVDHSDSNDNDELDPDAMETIRDAYCRFPIPEKYKLTHNLHRSVTTKAKFYNCKKRRRQDKERCDMVTGYYLDHREECRTAEDELLGNMPNLATKGKSILCTTPGKLTEIFDVGADLSEMTMMFVDQDKRCFDDRKQCNYCSQSCAQTMQRHHGSNPCNITGEDADNGESPRLANCHSCCARDDCTQHCEVYHRPECVEKRCVVGNLAEFTLEAEFSPQRTTFACHVEPVPSYKIYDITYEVEYQGQIVNNRRLQATKLFDGFHPENTIDEHGFLRVYHGSKVTTAPDLIQGDTSLQSFSAGYYQARGAALVDSSIRSNSVLVRPTQPFSVSTDAWRRGSCDTDLLSQLVMTSTDNDDVTFRQAPNVLVQTHGPQEYRLFNNTRADANDVQYMPFIYYEIPPDASILKAVHDDTTIKEDSSLKAELTRENLRWKLVISGQLSICPGYFGVKVVDPAYPRSALFHYDISVSCPNTFSVTFTVPTEGADEYDKKLLVELNDSFRKIKLTVFRPAPNETADAKAFFWNNRTQNSPVHYSQKGEKEMTIFTPFIAVLCVIISFLTLLLFVGFITERTSKPHKTENKVHSQHLLFVVCYVTFRAGYSIVVTFTVLLLLIQHFNRDSVSTLSEFRRYAETAENDQRLEIDHIQNYVMDELKRQNALANQTKFTCERKLGEVQNVLEDQKQQMRVETNEERLVSQVALQYTNLMIHNLTHSINIFKDEFSEYARKAVDQLERNVVQTSSALRSNQWLKAAELIHDSVRRKRVNSETKPFDKWAGIRQEVESLNVDLSLKNFPMPNLTEYLNIDIPKTNTKQSTIPRISEITLPQNKWYYQFEKKASEAGSSTLRPKRPRFKVSSDDIISWSSLIAILVVIDLIWFVHRMAKTYSTAKMILYGCPAFVDCRRAGTDTSPRKPAPKKSASSRCFSFLKDFNLRVMKTEFVPKVVATATTCCAVYLILAASDQLLTVKTLASVGYFESMVAPVETSYRLAKTRVKTNSYRINKFEYPFYEELVNVRTKRYQLMLDMYAELQKSNNLLHDSEYCAWRKLLHPGVACNCTTAASETLKFEGCELPPVTPSAYHKKDFGAYRDQLSRTIVPYVNSARQVVMDTCHLVMIFVAVLVLVDALGAVTWIYLKRFSLLRLKPMFEIEQFPAPDTLPNHT